MKNVHVQCAHCRRRLARLRLPHNSPRKVSTRQMLAQTTTRLSSSSVTASSRRQHATSARVVRAVSSAEERCAPADVSRRFVLAAPAFAALALNAPVAFAKDGPSVLVVGSTGATGRLVVSELAKCGAAGKVVAGVRSVEKAQKLGLGDSADAILGNVDVTNPAGLAEAFAGYDIVVVATGFVPGNPFKMNAAAHEVDNVGVCNVADAAKAAGVKRVVLISSILTNGRAMGAEDTPGFKITNAFGQVLDEKLVGENYLRASGVNWTIVRPAGLKNDEPKNSLVITDGDVMTSGEISRTLVAKVMTYAAFDASCENRIVEIAEEGSFAGAAPTSGKTFALSSDPKSWFA